MPNADLSEIEKLRKEGLSFAEIGQRLSMTRDKVGNIVRRHIRGVKDPSRAKDGCDRWTEERLTERWVDRKR